MDLSKIVVITKQDDCYVDFETRKKIERPVLFLDEAPWIVSIMPLNLNVPESISRECQSRLYEKIPEETQLILVGNPHFPPGKEMYPVCFMRFGKNQ